MNHNRLNITWNVHTVAPPLIRLICNFYISMLSISKLFFYFHVHKMDMEIKQRAVSQLHYSN